MKKIRIVLVVLIMCSLQCSFAQRQNRADRFFEKGDYINAAGQYELVLDQKGYSKDILQNISTCYYNTFQFRKAYRYLRILTQGKFYAKDKTYSNRYNFMMYQVLSALGEYDKSLAYLGLYQKNENTEPLDRAEAITTIESFKLKDNDYKVKAATFNSDASEFGAIKRDSTIYFTSDRKSNGMLNKRYKWTHRPFLNIFKVADGEVEPIPGKANSNLHEGNFCFSPDGTTMYISKSNADKGKKKFDSINNNSIHLYKSVKTNAEWGTPEKLSFNNTHYSIEHPSLSKDGTKLYFASNMPGGKGDFDIYYVEVNQDGTYGDPVNLGDDINTDQREQFPYISDEGNLFFSSNGHLGLGMMDVFVSQHKENKFTTPINLGAPINSKYDDFSFAYYEKKKGFFASNRKKINDDIYTFEQIGEIFPKEYLTRFEVKDYASDSYIKDASVLLFLNTGQILHEAQLDTMGYFEKRIYPGKYELKAEAKGYKAKTKSVVVRESEFDVHIIYLDKEIDASKNATNNQQDLTDIELIDITNRTTTIEETKSKEELKNTLLEDTEGPPVVEKEGRLFFELPPIYFDYNKWDIRADSKKVLDEFALKLEKYKSVYIKISAHTDSRGTDSYNKVLSEKRAESTRNYLALVGYVNARRMKFEGFGESQPIINCEEQLCTEEEHQINRRSEFEIVKY